MLKSITINHRDGAWTTTAHPPVTLQDPLILFFNEHESLPCQLNFSSQDAFGILGLTLAPNSGFVLTFRGVPTRFSMTHATHVPDAPITGANITIRPIPPGFGE